MLNDMLQMISQRHAVPAYLPTDGMVTIEVTGNGDWRAVGDDWSAMLDAGHIRYEIRAGNPDSINGDVFIGSGVVSIGTAMTPGEAALLVAWLIAAEDEGSRYSQHSISLAAYAYGRRFGQWADSV